jgi:DNA-binding LytR/AlgR family response regulator
MLARAWPELAIVAECGHGEDALDAIASKAPDIAFLDIRLPGLTGADFAQALSAGGEKCQVIFVSAYEQHALSAFGAGVFDYLLKPVSAERLQRTVAYLRDRLAHPGAVLLAPSALGGEIDRRNRPSDPARLRLCRYGVELAARADYQVVNAA